MGGGGIPNDYLVSTQLQFGCFVDGVWLSLCCDNYIT